MGDNSAFGLKAGNEITTGTDNVFAGAEAGANALQKADAVNSIAIGYQSYTTADNQVVLGNDQITETLLRGEILSGATPERLAAMWTTNDNYFFAAAGPADELTGAAVGNHGFGLRALSSLTTGITNTAFGFEALMSATTASDSTAFGAGALRVKISGVGDTAVGKDALLNCTTGQSNTGIGGTALENLTTGDDNTAVGHQAGNEIATGAANVFLGAETGTDALQKVDAVNSIAIGYQSFTTADNQVVLGNDQIAETLLRGEILSGATPERLAAMWTTNDNYFFAAAGPADELTGAAVGNHGFGLRALSSLTTGIANTAFGFEALMSATTASGNTAFGAGALRVKISGVGDTAIGKDALLNATTGQNNTGIGDTTLENLTTGDGNTAIGFHAGTEIDTGTGNVFVGSEAGTDPLQKVDAVNSISIGYQSYTTADNQVVIGNDQITQSVLRGEVLGGATPERLAAIWTTNQNYFFAAAGPAVELTGAAVGNHGFGLRALSSLTTGNGNTAFGYETLMSATTAADNTAFGSGALRVKVSGTGDTAIGKGALLSATTGQSNTGIGDTALEILTTGDGNAAVGYHAGNKVTTGGANVFVGSEAGTNALQKANAVNSISIGYQSYTTADNQVVLGNNGITETVLRGEIKGGATSERLAVMWTTNDNYFFASAGPATELTGTSVGNHGFGLRALSSVTTGITNTAFGYEALMSATTAIDNTAVGSGALRVKISGVGDTAVGKNAMLHCTTGQGNTGIGDTALEHLTTGDGNTAVGYSSGFGNTTGTSNAFFGAFAGGGLGGTSSTFSRCLAIGTESMSYNQTGNDNVMIGYRAGHTTTSSNNVCLGSEALRVLTSGGFNTTLGYRSGWVITTGIANVFVGSESGSNILQKVNASNSMALGYQTYTTANNQIVIGNPSTVDVLIGMGGSSTRFGIGTTTPAVAFDVKSTTGPVGNFTRDAGSSSAATWSTFRCQVETTAATVSDGFGPALGFRIVANAVSIMSGRLAFVRSGTDDSFGFGLYTVNAGVGMLVPKFYQRPDGNVLITNMATGPASGLPTTDPKSTLTVEGSLALSTRVVTATTTATVADYTIRCDAAAGAITVNLPAAASCPGRIYVVKKIDNVNNVTIDGNGAETIDGAATLVLTTQYQFARIQSNGTGWDVI